MRRKILLVDDDPVLLKLVTFMLQQGGFEVIAVADGDTAVDAYNHQSFDLIILDINIPGVEGFEFLREIRHSPGGPTIPVIMLTGRSDSMSVLKAKALGADDYMIKPPKREMLMNKVSNLIGRKPQEVEILFTENDTRSEGKIHLGMVLGSISANGIILYSNLAFEPGFIVNEVEIQPFNEIKAKPPKLKVVDCCATTNPLMKHFKYEIYLTWHKMSENDLNSLREWIIQTSLREKTLKAGGE